MVMFEKHCNTCTRSCVNYVFVLCLLCQTSLRACHHIVRRVFFVLRQLVLIASARCLQRLHPTSHLEFPHSRRATLDRIGFLSNRCVVGFPLDLLHLGNPLGCPRVHRGACQERRTQLTRGDGQTAWIMGQIHTRRNGLRLRSRETCETKCTQPQHSHAIIQRARTTATLAM